jgi:hypothetical protein
MTPGMVHVTNLTPLGVTSDVTPPPSGAGVWSKALVDDGRYGPCNQSRDTPRETLLRGAAGVDPAVLFDGALVHHAGAVHRGRVYGQYHQLMTPSMVHVTNRGTPGSDNPLAGRTVKATE